jgi:small subunit ribosomal protein S15
MHLTKVETEGIFTEYSPQHEAKDSGSAESQIALFSIRIKHLTEHLKQHAKDKSTQTGLLRLVGKRRRLLAYLQKVDIERYRAIIKQLGIRR